MKSQIFKITAVSLFFLTGFASAQSGFSSRAPFVVEMPEISATRYTAPVIRLPLKSVPSLKFRVLEPYATDIDYGKIIVTMNGNGINRGCDKRLDAQGKIVHCGRREDRLGGYELLPEETSSKSARPIKRRDANITLRTF